VEHAGAVVGGSSRVAGYTGDKAEDMAEGMVEDMPGEKGIGQEDTGEGSMEDKVVADRESTGDVEKETVADEAGTESGTPPRVRPARAQTTSATHIRCRRPGRSRPTKRSGSCGGTSGAS
jgi:hypothetical protein